MGWREPVMSQLTRKNRIRLLALCIFAGSVILLTGAGRFGDNLQSRRRVREQNREAVRQTIHTVLSGAMPEAGETDPLHLQELAVREPELVLSLLCSDLKICSRR